MQHTKLPHTFGNYQLALNTIKENNYVLRKEFDQMTKLITQPHQTQPATNTISTPRSIKQPSVKVSNEFENDPHKSIDTTNEREHNIDTSDLMAVGSK